MTLIRLGSLVKVATLLLAERTMNPRSLDFYLVEIFTVVSAREVVGE